MGKLTLWCLNRCARWDPAPLRAALASAGHEVTFGNRGEATPPFALQQEDGPFDEYFVPVVVKCVGDPARLAEQLGPRLTERGRAFLAGLPQVYADHYAAAGWERYWPPPDCKGLGMNTSKGRGYYELLAERTDGTRAVLVGYSQGGLVARFLAWLDEALVSEAERCIAGVITVQSPNRGSPLADPDNADNVLLGALRAIGVVSGGKHFKATPPPGNAEARQDVQRISHLLDRLAKYSGDELKDVFVTARKWLSGLAPEAYPFGTAFSDLNTAELDRPGSVLHHLLHEGLQRTWEGAVVGTQNQLSMSLPTWPRRLVRLFRRRWLDLADEASAQYSEYAMNEAYNAPTLSREVQRLADEYRQGVNVLGLDGALVRLEPWAHDFVIPSASQALGPSDPTGGQPPKDFFLGNAVNRSANHISGGATKKGNDSGLVCELLEKLSRRLAEEPRAPPSAGPR